jgi:hypothetical protein
MVRVKLLARVAPVVAGVGRVVERELRGAGADVGLECSEGGWDDGRRA